MAIRPYIEADFSALFRLYRSFSLRQFEGQRGQEYWRWRCRCPQPDWFVRQGFPRLYFHEGELAGCLGAFPTELRYGGQVLTGLILTDFFFLPQHPGAGAFLAMSVRDAADIIVCSNGPEDVLAIFGRIGFQRLPHEHCALHRRLAGKARAALMRGGELLSTGKNDPESVPLPGAGLVWKQADGAEGVAAIKSGFLPDALKSAGEIEFLKWRVQDHPGKMLALWVGYGASDGIPLCYVVLERHRRKSITPCQALVCDFGYVEARLSATQFIGSVERLALALGCDVATWFMSGAWMRELVSVGYEKVWSEPMFCRVPQKPGLPETRNWQLNLLDTEKFLYPRTS